MKTKSRKYRALEILSGVYIAVAALVFLGGLIVGGGAILTSIGSSSRFASSAITSGFFILVGSFVSAVSLAAFAQLIEVILEMLENSRQQTRLLQYLAKNSKN